MSCSESGEAPCVAPLGDGGGGDRALAALQSFPFSCSPGDFSSLDWLREP